MTVERLALALGAGEVTSPAAARARIEALWPERGRVPAWRDACSIAAMLADVRRMQHRLRAAGAMVLLAGDPGYPLPLVTLPDRPAVLYVRGDPPRRPMLAVVGSRAASRGGTTLATELAGAAVRAGHGVLSGGALGIDAAGHRGALQVGCPEATAAVLGSGLDNLYPPRHLELFDEIARVGALVTPFAPSEPPRRAHFPQRNRLIAAWATAVLVVEANVPSGALNTARHARDLGRPLLACPGSRGTDGLLGQGARQVRDAGDLLDALAGRPADPEPAAPPARDRQVWSALGRRGQTAQEIAKAAGLSVGQIAATLLRLELDGWAQAGPGGRYTRGWRR